MGKRNDIEIVVSKVLPALRVIYGEDENELNYQINRYTRLIGLYDSKFENNKITLFSAPGRTELSGNHTDHNNGKVLAASINLDTVGIVAKTNDQIVTVYSEGFDDPFIVDLNDLELNEDEFGTTNSIIRGIAAKFKELNYEIGGFNAVISSDVLIGSGLSSSASIEILIGVVFDRLFNQNTISVIELSKIAQYAENVFFGKPCGLMDQIACANGGIVSIDFKDAENPIVNKVEFEFEKEGYKIVIVNTGGNHVDLTDDYASIPAEMLSVAKLFNKNSCRELSSNELYESVDLVRESLGDRAFLRAAHFFDEQDRVDKQVEFLNDNKFDDFLKLVNESGNSSYMWLQNSYSIKNPAEQGISLALFRTKKFIEQLDKQAACRVHGGGFAGTILAILPEESVEDYVNVMNKIFGEDSSYILEIREKGVYEVVI